MRWLPAMNGFRMQRRGTLVLSGGRPIWVLEVRIAISLTILKYQTYLLVSFSPGGILKRMIVRLVLPTWE
jgi:hypothetical protein